MISIQTTNFHKRLIHVLLLCSIFGQLEFIQYVNFLIPAVCSSNVDVAYKANLTTKVDNTAVLSQEFKTLGGSRFVVLKHYNAKTDPVASVGYILSTNDSQVYCRI